MANRSAMVLVLCGSLGMTVAMDQHDAEARARRAHRSSRRSAEDIAKSLQRRLVKKAERYFAQKRFYKAAETFKKAYKALPHYSIQLKIAIAYASRGDNPQAYQHLVSYTKMKQASDPPLPDMLQDLHLKVGTIVILVPESKAGVFVDGQLKGNNEVRLYFEPSKQVVELKIEGRVVATRTFDVKAGKEYVWKLPRKMVEVPMRPPVVIPPFRPRREVAFIPFVPTKSQEEKKGRDGNKSGDEKKGRDENKSRDGKKGRDGETKGRPYGVHLAYFTTAAALTVAALGAAVYTSVKDIQIHNEYDKDRYNVDLRRKGILVQNAANGLWGVTAAAAITTTVLGYFTGWYGKRAEERTVTVAPWSGPGSLGLSLTVMGK